MLCAAAAVARHHISVLISRICFASEALSSAASALSTPTFTFKDRLQVVVGLICEEGKPALAFALASATTEGPRALSQEPSDATYGLSGHASPSALSLRVRPPDLCQELVFGGRGGQIIERVSFVAVAARCIGIGAAVILGGIRPRRRG